jgi:hypothetical protein
VENKSDLFTVMAGTFYDKAFESVPDGLPWRAWLLTYGTALRSALLAHRDSAVLCVNAKPEKQGREKLELLASPLIAAGLPRKVALSYQASVIFLVLGATAYEQSRGLHDYLATYVGFEESFKTGLNSMVAGFGTTDAERATLAPSGSKRQLKARSVPTMRQRGAVSGAKTASVPAARAKKTKRAAR